VRRSPDDFDVGALRPVPDDEQVAVVGVFQAGVPSSEGGFKGASLLQGVASGAKGGLEGWIV
jgi:hypothetical protein